MFSFSDRIETNKIAAFKHFVKCWKKQDENTVVVNGNEYSYTMRGGVVKKYVGFNSFNAYKNSEFYPQHPERVCGFIFVEIKSNPYQK